MFLWQDVVTEWHTIVCEWHVVLFWAVPIHDKHAFFDWWQQNRISIVEQKLKHVVGTFVWIENPSVFKLHSVVHVGLEVIVVVATHGGAEALHNFANGFPIDG